MQEGKRRLPVSGFEWDLTLSQQDTGDQGWLRGSSLLHRFETIASAHVDSLNLGFEQMIAKNRIWVMTKIRYAIYKKVGAGSSCHLGTYPRPKKGLTFYRDYYLWDEAGDVAAAATSQWCILNFRTRRPERTEIEVPGECIDYEPFDTGIGKIRWKPEEGSSPALCRLVGEADLDQNQHTNNCRYADMIDEALGTSEHRDVTIHFARETRLGDEILLYTDGKQYVTGTLPDGTMVFKSQVSPQPDT